METSIQIGLWILTFLVLAIFLSLDVFYLRKFIKNWRGQKRVGNTKHTAVLPEQRQKIKAEILSDLEKKLEAL